MPLFRARAAHRPSPPVITTAASGVPDTNASIMARNSPRVPWRTPDRRASSVLRAMRGAGPSRSTIGNRALYACMQRTRICSPGEMAPPWKTPSASTRSYVMQEPASMASTALPGKRRWAPTAFAARSMPSVCGVSYALGMGSGDRASISVTGARAPSSPAAEVISTPTEATPMRCGTRPSRKVRTAPIPRCGYRSTRTGLPPSNRAIFTRVLPTSMISSMQGDGAYGRFRIYLRPRSAKVSSAADVHKWCLSSAGRATD